MRLASPWRAVAVLLAAATVVAAPADPTPPLRGDLEVHDPALVAGGPGERWYVFSSGRQGTGGGTVAVRSSEDGGLTWAAAGTVWDALPSWATASVPGAQTMWAPAIRRHGGSYYLYYAVSTTGHNDSVIGLATNTTLDPADPDYEWVDRGEVVRSRAADDVNAIDPEVVEDDAGTPWLVFGSFWSGIHMVQLEWPSGKRSADPQRWHLADRRIDPNAVEGPAIVRHGGWYYLLTSWDRCCQGVQSTYRIVAGRSRSVTGPYVDREGKELLAGGGTTLLATSGNRIGPGGQSVSDGVVAYHYYDGDAGGAPRLGLRRLTWSDDGWPVLPPGDGLTAPSGTD